MKQTGSHRSIPILGPYHRKEIRVSPFLRNYIPKRKRLFVLTSKSPSNSPQRALSFGFAFGGITVLSHRAADSLCLSLYPRSSRYLLCPFGVFKKSSKFSFAHFSATMITMHLCYELSCGSKERICGKRLAIAWHITVPSEWSLLSLSPQI